ncbi:hypothetical protein D915_009581 [Fasciola hepatica]|uniref:Saposin B-type domain-containing protein n=1 Tax=Fasciola hepatica TaxID=6192 RepID=A0A4E0RBE3_FASHE|nr:hypothetical protein D915_009581 [Fasciola hepatica]
MKEVIMNMRTNQMDSWSKGAICFSILLNLSITSYKTVTFREDQRSSLNLKLPYENSRSCCSLEDNEVLTNMYSTTIVVYLLLAMVCMVRAELLLPCSNGNALVENEIDNVDKCPMCKATVEAAKVFLTSADFVKIEKEGIEFACHLMPVFTFVCTAALHKGLDFVVKELKGITSESVCTVSPFVISTEYVCCEPSHLID